MNVVCHENGGWVGGCRDGGDGWYACGTKPGVGGRMLRDAVASSGCEVKILMTPDHTAGQMRSSG